MKDGSKKIVVIGANSFQDRLIKEANGRGFETHVFAWAAGDVGERSCDYFYPISITEKDEILEECRKIHPDAVCSVASDLAVVTVNYVARNLGLVANSEESDEVSTNKFKMREALLRAGLQTPWHYKVSSHEVDRFVRNANISYPAIVKPTDRSGSRGITKLNDKDKLMSALCDAINQSFEKAAIVEEYIDLAAPRATIRYCLFIRRFRIRLFT